MKRLIAFALAAVMVISLLTGCGGGIDSKLTTEAPTIGGVETEGDDQSTETPTDAPKIEIEYPLADAGSLTWFVQTGIDLHADYVEPTESPLHNYLSTATGVDIQWQMVPVGGNAKTYFNLILEEDPLPNVITGDNIRYEELFLDELIYDLTPYLEEYAPDYWAWLNEDEQRLKEVSLTTGEIVYFASGVEELNCYSYGPLIRKDWLDECGLEIPYTLDEWETVLKVFKDKYGIAPLGAAKAIWNGLFGMASGTGAHGGLKLNLYLEDGTVTCAQVQEEWKEIIITLNRWWEEGLIDPDIGSITKSGILPKAANGQIGLVICDEAHSSKIPYETSLIDPEAEWIAIPYAVPNKGDSPVYTRYEGMNKNHATVITTSCSEEELITAIKMLNYGYTDEGILTWNFGEQGVSWEYDANGEVQLTDLVINDPVGKTGAINKYSPMNDGIAPSIKINRFAELRYDSVTIDAFEKWGGNSKMLDYRIPTVRYTLDEDGRRADLITSIETYLTPFASKCIKGDLDIEAEWDNFIGELNTLGLQEVIDLTQTAYDRMYKD